MGVKLVKEITSGSSASLALSASGGGGGAGLQYQRSWRLLYDNPADHQTTDVRDHIGVTIGTSHPSDTFCVCDAIDVKPDGDSRHAYIVTAKYSSAPLSLTEGGAGTGETGDQNADPRSQPPDSRKANWSTDASTIEAPSWHWRPGGAGNWVPAINPVGDLYDGVMTMQPIVTVKVEQTQARDPNIFAMFIGQVNSNAFRIGALQCDVRSVMLKGISSTPHSEVIGKRRWRGWKANYEFVYKPGFNSFLNLFLGWDVAIPVSGFNVLNLAGAQARNDVDKGALSLRLTNDTVGSIANWPNAVIEPTLVGEKTRANVLISAPNSKAMQRPSAQPVPLNTDGTPRARNLLPLIQRYQVFADFNMANLGIRLD